MKSPPRSERQSFLTIMQLEHAVWEQATTLALSLIVAEPCIDLPACMWPTLHHAHDPWDEYEFAYDNACGTNCLVLAVVERQMVEAAEILSSMSAKLIEADRY
jgi:hypothetical protein